MTISEIRNLPTCVSVPNGSSVHESVLRSYACLEKVKELLKQKCPHEIILELIEDMTPQSSPVLEWKEMR